MTHDSIDRGVSLAFRIMFYAAVAAAGLALSVIARDGTTLELVGNITLVAAAFFFLVKYAGARRDRSKETP